jgi:hypothetical protein
MKYLEQKARMERLYNKINPKTDFHGNQIDYEDNLWFFFQTAWHLKDWIKNDPAIRTYPSIEKIANNVKSLRICADLANRSKHLELKLDSNREDGRLAGNDVNIFMGSGKMTIEEAESGKIPIMKALGSKYTYWISDKSGIKTSAVELAEQIMKDWEEIIIKYVEAPI